MKPRPGVLLPTAALLVGAPLCSQTFVVDAANGPGTDFTTIAAAVAAVPDGAVLRVRAGTYGDFAIDAKSLSVIGEPGVIVARANSPSKTIVVRNLGASQSVRFHGLLITGSHTGPPALPAEIELWDSLGDVVMQECRGVTVPPYLNGAWLTATNCRSVRLLDCEIRTGFYNPAITLKASTAHLAATTLETIITSSGLHLENGSSAELADCTVWGGGATAGGAALTFATSGGTARLLGTTQLRTDLYPSLNAPAIGGPGVVVMDPTVQLLANVAPIGPAVVVTMRSMPVVSAHTEALGGVAHGSFVVPPGGIGGLFAGPSSAAVTLPPIADPVFLDPSLAVPMAYGTAGAAVTASYAVPSAAWALGVCVGWQGWSYDPAAGFQGSNAVFTIHW